MASSSPSTAPGRSRFARSREALQSLKARADAKRTSSQRLADAMTSAFGSNVFLLVNLAWFTAWAVINLGFVPGVTPFDPFPFGLLTVIVSLEAILLSIFVLSAQRRSYQIDQLRQEIDLQINLIAEEELTKLLSLVAKIAQHQGIDLSTDDELLDMITPTNVENIERVLAGQVLKATHHNLHDPAS
jgi:uncharacterized membrane protein